MRTMTLNNKTLPSLTLAAVLAIGMPALLTGQIAPKYPPDPMQPRDSLEDPLEALRRIPGIAQPPGGLPRNAFPTDPMVEIEKSLAGPRMVDPFTGIEMTVQDFNRRKLPDFGAPPVYGEPRHRNHRLLELPVTDGAPSPLGEFAAETPAERMLEDLLRKAERDVDIGIAGYLVAADLPAFQNLAPEEYSAELSRITDRVGGILSNAPPRTGAVESHSDPGWPAYAFASAMHGLGWEYPEPFRKTQLTAAEAHAMFRDERNVMLPGLLQTHQGSCVTLPLLYVVVAQRLRLPVHLVTVGQHTFARWDDGKTRLNIEATITDRVAIAEDDSVYIRLEQITPQELAGTNTLRNLTNREVVGVLFHARSGIYAAHGYRREALRDAARAVELNPESRMARLHLQDLKARIAKVAARPEPYGPELPPEPERTEP